MVINRTRKRKGFPTGESGSVRALGVRCGFGTITDQRFPDYIRRRMRGMAVTSYLNCRPGNIVVKYSREGGYSQIDTKWGGGTIVGKISNTFL